MCFSATASFTTGAVLTGNGVVSLRNSPQPDQKPFAAIPLIFGIQQISEGFLWLALSEPGISVSTHWSMYAFLFFAQVLWPFWVPWSVGKLEKQRKRKFFLRSLMVVGALVSLYLGFCLVRFNVSAAIEGHHIRYSLNFPEAIADIGGLLYLLATIVPMFVSSVRYMIWLGLAILIAYIVTVVFFTAFVISVWCFFAAVISIMVLFIMDRLNRKEATDQ